MRDAIVIVDHGSRLPEANALLESVAEALRRRRRGVAVEVAHMELAEPSLAQALRRCAERGASEVVVLPYFLGPGRHTTRDIPSLLEELRGELAGLRISVAEPLGFDPRLIDVLLSRVDAVPR